jgi:hypothetical protein
VSDKLTGKAVHAPTDDERIAVARAIHDGPSAVLELATMMIAPHGFDECAHKATYLADADAVLAAGFRRTEVPEPSADEFALRITVRAEAIGGGKESLDVDVDMVEPSTPAWTAGLLRQIANDLDPVEPQGEPSDGQQFTPSVDAVRDVYVGALVGDGSATEQEASTEFERFIAALRGGVR